MAPTSMRRTAFLVGVMLCIIVCGVPSAVEAKKKLPTKFSYFLHEKDLAPNNTEVFIASPSGQLKVVEFGTLGAASDNMRVSASNTSEIVGKTQYFFSVQQDVNIFLNSGVTVLNTTEFQGTISWHGVEDFSQIVQEVAITGGTGDFRFIRGYIITELVAADYVNQVFVAKFTFYVKYD